MARFIDELKRTHLCGSLRASDVGSEVVLFGWVATRRDHGGCVFIDLRDRDGVTQVVFDPAYRPEGIATAAETVAQGHKLAEEARGEWVLGVRGVVVSRGTNKNPKLPTGEIEVHVVEATVFNKARRRPSRSPTRSTRARRSGSSTATSICAARPLQRTLRMRHEINQATRSYLADAGLPRARDAVHGEVHARRRAQLPRPLAPHRRQVLRARREPAALQAALHGGGLRPLLPDREVLPRRGPARSIASPSSRRSTSRCRSSTRTTSSA